MSKTGLIIIGIVAAVLILILLVFLVLHSLGGGTTTEPAYLQFWGVYDDSSLYSGLISDYQKLHPNVHIVYRQFGYEDYERALLEGFAAGTGPDIWLMHNTWLPKEIDKLAPLPQTTLAGESAPLFTIKDFREQFVDVALTDLTSNGQIYALPLYTDTLALYYNKNLFNSAGLAIPPPTWDEFNADVKRLTQADSRGNISQAGAALGTARNINRSTDILMLLMLQSGVQMTDSEYGQASFAESVEGQNVGEIALQYYTDFANPAKAIYTWNEQQHYSIDAFLEGRLAMMLNYSHQIQTLRAKAPRFDFAVASVPQLGAGQTSVNFANYWAATVWKGSKNPNEAWRFLTYLTSSAGASKYINAAGRPAARRDLLTQQQSDPDLGVFARQALSARSWYQMDNTAIETIFADMIDDINYSRASLRDALQSAESKVNVLMQKIRR